MPCVRDLAADSSQYVRSALASVVMELAPVLGKQATIDQLLPVFLSLLRDDFPDVRLNVISKLDQASLLPALSGTLPLVNFGWRCGTEHGVSACCGHTSMWLVKEQYSGALRTENVKVQ